METRETYSARRITVGRRSAASATRPHSTDRKQFLRMVVVAALSILIAVGGMVRPVRAAGTVVATGVAATDLANVQAAVNEGGVVTLQNGGANGEIAFDFGTGYVGIWNPVEIIGRNATIKNGIYGFAVGTGGVVIRDIDFENQAEHSIYLRYADNCTVSTNTITNAGKSGIYVYESNNCTVSTNTITNAGKRGIYVYESNNCTISTNTLKDIQALSSSRGIQVSKSDNCTFSTNTLTDCRDGIYLSKDSHGNTVQGNTFSNVLKAIRVRKYPFDNTVQGNTIDGGNTGIDVYADNNRFLENTVRNTKYGVRLDTSSGNMVQGNTIEHSSSRGIRVKAGGTNTFQGNIINDAHVGIRLYDGTSGNTVQGNTIGSCDRPIEILSDNNAIQNNIIGTQRPGARAGILCFGDNNVIANNDFKNSGIMGLKDDPEGKVCVKLAVNVDISGNIKSLPENNFVFESGDFMPGTGGAKFQVVDGWAVVYDEDPSSIPADSLPNRVVGHPADVVAQQEGVHPGMGQYVRELVDDEPSEVDDEPSE